MTSLKVLPLVLLASAATAQILSVPHGGTGNTTLTQYGPLLGNGTGPVTALAPGTAGQCLISGGPSAPPVFAACPGGVGGGPGAGSCSVNQYVNALVNGSPPTCSQVTYSQIGGTLTANTTGTAAGITGNGTANQVWGMNTGGTAQGWQAPSGGGGPVSISSLTGATANTVIPFGQYLFSLTFDSNTSPSGSYLYQVGEVAAGTTASPNNREVMAISAKPGSTSSPLGVYSGSTGFFIFDANGELQARGTGAKFVGPMVLTTAGNPGTLVANAPALGTDPNGNIIPTSAPGGGGALYSARHVVPLMQTTGDVPIDAANCSAGICTAFTPTANGMYIFYANVANITNNTACSAQGVFAFQMQWTDPDVNQLLAWQNQVFRLMNGTTFSGSIATTNYTGPASMWQLMPVNFMAKAGTPVNYKIAQTTASAGCTPQIVVNVRIFGPY